MKMKWKKFSEQHFDFCAYLFQLKSNLPMKLKSINDIYTELGNQTESIKQWNYVSIDHYLLSAGVETPLKNLCFNASLHEILSLGTHFNICSINSAASSISYLL